MKYYFLLPELESGGAEQVSLQFALKLKNEGKEVSFLNIGKPEGELLCQIESNFKIDSLGCDRVLRSFFKLYKYFKKEKECVLFSSREHLSVVLLLTNLLLKKTTIIRIPSMPKNQLGKGWTRIKERIILRINSFLLSTANVIIAQTDEMRDQILDVYSRLDSKRVITLYNPINVDRIHSLIGTVNPYNENVINYVAVGNISIAKGYETLLDAFVKLKNAVPNAALTILGRNTSEYGISLTNKLTEIEGINVLGYVSNPYPYINYCDVFVLSSRMEGFPNVVLEAMSLNKPVVATECVPVIKKIIIDGVNGYTIPVEDSRAMAEKMEKAINLTMINNNYDLFNKDVFLKIFNNEI